METKKYLHRHPVIGIYLFYENWLTETFRMKGLMKWVVYYTSPQFEVIWSLPITGRNLHKKRQSHLGPAFSEELVLPLDHSYHVEPEQ